MTQLEILNEKRNELQAKMDICNFAFTIQSKIEEYKALNNKLHEIELESDPVEWMFTYDKQTAIEKQIVKEFRKMSKKVDLGITKKSYFIHDLVYIWNHFCYKFEYSFLIDCE